MFLADRLGFFCFFLGVFCIYLFMSFLCKNGEVSMLYVYVVYMMGVNECENGISLVR